MKNAISKILTFLAILTLSFIVYIFARNLIPTKVYDVDLIYYPQKIEDNENAYIMLLPALKQIRGENLYHVLDEFITDEKLIDYAKAEGVLNQYPTLLSTFSKAVAKDFMQLPAQLSPYEAKKEIYGRELNFLHKLKWLNVKILLKNQEYDKALNGTLELLKYGYLLQNSDSSLLYFMLGTIVKVKALDLLNSWITDTNYKSTSYKAVLDTIDKYLNNDSMDKSLKLEYIYIANTLKGILGHELTTSPERLKQFRLYGKYFYDEAASLNAAAAYFRQEIQNLKGDFANIRHKKIYRPSNVILQYLYIFTGNITGKILLQMTLPRLDGRVEEKIRTDARCNLSRLLLAVKACYVENQQLPANLNKLVPQYIEYIPKDSIDNNDLRYSRSKKVIYSIDENMRDDGGDKEKDLCYKLNF